MTTSLTLSALVDQIRQTGRPVDVEFAQANPKEFSVNDLESYAVPGMRARLTSGQNELQDDVTKIFVDFAPFEEHNRGFETRDFYHTDENGKRVLTDARTAGQYNAQDTFYVPSSMPASRLLNMVEGPAQALINAWQAQGTGESYVSFLEEKVSSLLEQHKASLEASLPTVTQPRRARPA